MSNHKEIEKHSEKITKNKPFINKDKWEGLNLPSKKDNPELSEKNNVTIAVNVLYIKKEKIYPAYVLNVTQVVKNKFYDPKRMALSSSKQTISIIKRNNF